MQGGKPGSLPAGRGAVAGPGSSRSARPVSWPAGRSDVLARLPQALRIFLPLRFHAVVVEHPALLQLSVLALDRRRLGVELRVVDGHFDPEAEKAVTRMRCVALDDARLLAVRGGLVDALGQAGGLDHQRIAFPMSPGNASAAGQDIGRIDLPAVEEYASHLIVRLINDRQLLGPLD